MLNKLVNILGRGKTGTQLASALLETALHFLLTHANYTGI